MLSEVNVKATIQCHYSWSCQEKKGRGLFIPTKDAFSAENGLLTQVSVYMFVELSGPFCCRIRRSCCTRKTLFILASCSRWCLAGCWCGTAEDPQSQPWLWRRARVRCGADPAAVYVAGMRAEWLSMGSLPAGSRTRIPATRAFRKKRERTLREPRYRSGLFTAVSLHARLRKRDSRLVGKMLHPSFQPLPP